MKTKTLSLISQIQNVDNIDLSKSKLLIGKGENCDLTLKDSSISHYHALISLSEEGIVTIMDLGSHNGVYINGNRITALSVLGEGDQLSLGKLHFDLIENNEDISIENLEAEVEVLEVSNKVYVPQARNANEILIDDEYCDIVFNEETFKPLEQSPIRNLDFINSDYIQNDELDSAFDLTKENFGDCIQVTTLVSGSVLDQYYLPLSNQEYTATNIENRGSIFIDILSSDKTPFIKVENGQIKVNELEGFTLNKETLATNDKTNIIILTNKTYQIFIEMAYVPSNLIDIPKFIREKDFFKESSKIFASIMVPMLLLLFVNFEVPKPKKKLSIIYKKPTNAKVDGKTLSSKNPNSESKNTGHKSTKQPDKKVAHKKAGEKSKAQPKKALAKAAPTPQKATKKAKAPVKAYQFKMASNVNSLFNSGKQVAKAQSRSVASIANTSAVSGSLNTKVTGTASSKVGSLGSDLAGAEASMGSQGLSSKKGRDTSYIQTKTVVLGSMDPELLRKILKRYLPQFRHCYQQELAYNSEDIKGIVDLDFEISGAGRVAKMDIKAKDNRFSKRGIDCMGKVLSIIDFPKPKGGGRVAVRQPLSFFSEKENG